MASAREQDDRHFQTGGSVMPTQRPAVVDCRICHGATLKQLLDLGVQAVGNQYASRDDAPVVLHPMQMGQCECCGAVQMINVLPASELKPAYDWITYNEPERHLDSLVRDVLDLPGIDSSSVICGVSYKEDTTIERFRKLNVTNASRVLESQLGIQDDFAGIETIQECIRPAQVEMLRAAGGAPDVVIARHILEHASDPLAFIEALREFVAPEGFLVLEVPDCTAALETFDYTTLWEEHATYFTPAVFRHFLALARLDCVAFECYPYHAENSLVAIARVASGDPQVRMSSGLLAAELQRVQSFASEYPLQKARIREYLTDYVGRHGKIAVFGAGHLACTFIGLFEVPELIEFVADDHERKKGMFMPGSRLPIRGSDVLESDLVSMCLSTLSPESEKRVLASRRELFSRLQYRSIFPRSEHALEPLRAE